MPFINQPDLNTLIEAIEAHAPALGERLWDALHTACQARDNVGSAELLQRAADIHAYDELEIDDAPAVSQTDRGDWVAAWVWVPCVDEDGEA